VADRGTIGTSSRIASRGGQSLPVFAQLLGRNDSPYLANKESQRTGAVTQRMDHDLSLQLSRRAWPGEVEEGSERPVVGQIWPRGNP